MNGEVLGDVADWRTPTATFGLLRLVAAGMLLWGFLAMSAVSANAKEKPNILFILSDDLGKEWISSYGAEDLETPHLDALAAGGIRFENAYVMPQCTPTRLSLLTGQYPFRHGWVNHWDVPRWGGGAHYDWERNPSIARVMQKAGYKTAVAGKWQISDFRVQPDAMNRLGFDDYCMWTGYEEGVPASAERYWDPYLHTKDGSRTYPGEFGEDIFVDFLVDFMKQNQDEPMFLYYPMCLPHSPFVTTPAEPDAQGKLGKHKAMVRYVDTIVGRLVEALEALDLREDTIVIWTGDNGTTGSISGTLNGRLVKGGKATTTEAGVCVPFIVNGPGRVAEGKVSPALLSVADLLPTFADLAGTKPDPKYEYDGISVKDALLGKSKHSEHDWILAMGGRNEARLTKDGVENAYVYRDRVLRTERFKLFVNTKGEPERLVDLKKDPWEERDVLGQESRAVRQAMAIFEKALTSMPVRDNDPIYTPLAPQPWDVEISAEAEVWKQ